MTVPHSTRLIAGYCAALFLLGLAGAGCGCRKREDGRGAVDQLRQTRLRFSQEPQKRTCYVVAEVANTGKAAVREAKVTATLISRSGKQRGLNHSFLRDIEPGEKRTFYMTVTTHGSLHRVELSFHEPGDEG